MPEVKDQDSTKFWQAKGVETFFYLLKNWYFLLIAAGVGGVVGYYYIHNQKPVYSSTFTFVLSTDQRPGGGFAMLASQLGVDNSTSGSDNIFTGDNIIELFKSRALIGNALQTEIDTTTHLTLLNYIAKTEYPGQYRNLGSFGKNADTYSARKIVLYRRIIGEVAKIFMVYKKDKKLIFYAISANSTDPNIAYFVSKCMLDETSRYFIETKTKVARAGVKLLKHEVDSLSGLLKNTLTLSAGINDRTYNLNPTYSTQRSVIIFNQATITAFTQAYGEVMRNLEASKINLQKETPLYRIIDVPELPLLGAKESVAKHTVITAIIALLLMALTLGGDYLYKTVFKK